MRIGHASFPRWLEILKPIFEVLSFPIKKSKSTTEKVAALLRNIGERFPDIDTMLAELEILFGHCEGFTSMQMVFEKAITLKKILRKSFLLSQDIVAAAFSVVRNERIFGKLKLLRALEQK